MCVFLAAHGTACMPTTRPLSVRHQATTSLVWQWKNTDQPRQFGSCGLLNDGDCSRPFCWLARFELHKPSPMDRGVCCALCPGTLRCQQDETIVVNKGVPYPVRKPSFSL